MMGFVLAFLAGVVFASFLPDSFRDWVRGVAGKARGFALGAAPARTLTEVSPPPANKPINAGKAIANVLGFFGNLLAWIAKHPVPAIGLVLLALFLVFGAPSCSPFGKSRGELRLEREIAEANTRIAEFEASIGALSGQLAENTERDRHRVTTIITQANEEIDNAVEAVDPSALYDVYRRSYDGVWLDLASPGESDSATRRPDTVRGAPPNST